MSWMSELAIVQMDMPDATLNELYEAYMADTIREREGEQAPEAPELDMISEGCPNLFPEEDAEPPF